jgi:hypothetical protein
MAAAKGRSDGWQAEVRVMDRIGRAMAEIDTLPLAAQERVRARVAEEYGELPRGEHAPATKQAKTPEATAP